MRTSLFFVLSAACAAPLFSQSAAKAAFSKESALSYTIYTPEGLKKDYTLTLSGGGAVKTFTLGKLQGSAQLENDSLVLTLGGRKLAPMTPKPIAGGRLVIWAQTSPAVRIAVPASYKSLRDKALADALQAELDALAPMPDGGYEEEGYPEEGG